MSVANHFECERYLSKHLRITKQVSKQVPKQVPMQWPASI